MASSTSDAPELFEGLDRGLDEGITFAEMNGELVCLDGSERDAELKRMYRTLGGLEFPSIELPERFQRGGGAAQIYSRPPEPTLWEQLASFVPWLRVPLAERPAGDCSVLSVSWNPSLPVIAVALRSDAVYCFDFDTGTWSDSLFIAHAKQINVTTVKWRPEGSPNELAVASSSGICFWFLHSGKSVTGDCFAGASMRHFDDGERGLMTAIDWSPDGYYLASGRQDSSYVYVWDVNEGKNIFLDCPGGGERAISWSPDGAFLIVSGKKAHFYIFDAVTWTRRDWRAKDGPASHLAWHSSSSSFFTARGNLMHRIEMRAELNRLTPLATESFRLPFPVSDMLWSPCGRRLVVAFRDQPLIGVLETNARNVYCLGYIKGDATYGQVACMSWKKGFRHGALLAVVWTAGRLSFLPFFQK